MKRTAKKDPLATAIARAKAAEKERDEIQGVFDRSWAANMRGIKAWQAAHPGNDLVWPDRAKLVEWLVTRLFAYDQALRRIANMEPAKKGLDPRFYGHAVKIATDALAKQD